MAPAALNGDPLPDTPISTVLVIVGTLVWSGLCPLRRDLLGSSSYKSAKWGLYLCIQVGDALESVIHHQFAEIAPLVERLKLAEDAASIFPAGVLWKKYSGVYKKINVHAITPGKDEIYDVDHVGTVPASLITFAAVQAVKPDLIINAGTAGGFKRKGAKIGDVFIVTETANHDRRIPIGNFVGYGIGALRTTPAPNLVKELSLKEGKVSTGNSLDITPKDEEIILANDASLKDMEGAAVAYVADILRVPLVLLKAVTDIVDGDRPTTEEFLENLSTAAHALQDVIYKVFDLLSERNLSDL